MSHMYGTPSLLRQKIMDNIKTSRNELNLSHFREQVCMSEAKLEEIYMSILNEVDGSVFCKVAGIGFSESEPSERLYKGDFADFLKEKGVWMEEYPEPDEGLEL